MSAESQERSSTIGWTSFAIGTVALFAALFVFWAGPFAPQQSSGVSLGELAAEIGKSAARSMLGAEQPAPAPVARDIDDYLQIAVSMIGALAVVSGIFAFVRHESPRPAIAGVVLGVGAIVFQFFAMAFFAVLGVLIIMALLHSLGDTFSSIFGG